MSVYAEDRAFTIAHSEGSVRAMGLGHVWDVVVAGESATSSLVLGILGTVATYLEEMGYAPLTEDVAA